MIGPYFDGGSGLDLFAGTGGLGIEALSRGLDRAIFIDMESTSIQVIQENLQATKLTEKAEVYRNEALRALKVLARRELRFDLVFLDPPYRLKSVDDILLQMQELKLLQNDAIVLVEHEAVHTYAESIGECRLRKHAVYGDTAITIYDFIRNDFIGGE
ncbi:MAG: methyltransferase [Bacilli bacterium]|nr:methyltransferase [Bacilli bacterium]